MAEEEKNDSVEQEPEAVGPESQAAASEAQDAPEPPAAAKAPPAPAAPAAGTQAPPAAPAEVVAPKERRRRARATKASKTPSRAPRTPEERHADRLADRRRKAALRRLERQRARAKASAAPAAASTPQPPVREHGPGVQKTRQGVVVSDRAEKTITVRVDTARRHRRYEKIVRTSRTLHAHDERGDAHVGDTVIVRESRPLSRTKRWRLVEVVERAK
jgi:small subunit ribosomal protein S17